MAYEDTPIAASKQWLSKTRQKQPRGNLNFLIYRIVTNKLHRIKNFAKCASHWLSQG